MKNVIVTIDGKEIAEMITIKFKKVFEKISEIEERQNLIDASILKLSSQKSNLVIYYQDRINKLFILV